MLNSPSWQRPIGQTRRFATAILALTCAACGRAADRAANDTEATVDSLRVDTSVAAPVFRDWTLAAGRHLLVSAGTSDTAIVVFPEFTIDLELADADFTLGPDILVPYDLIAADGSISTGRLTHVMPAPRAGCDTWPIAKVIGDSIRPWTIGLSTGVARAVAYKALNDLQGRDSAALMVNLSRLASQAPNDTAATLRGLPYVVRSAYGATVADSQSFVLAELVRRVNVEANPYEERVTVIGEKPVRNRDGPYTLLFSERHSGDEERVPTTDLVGLVVLLRQGTYTAFATREFSDGGTYLMFERKTDGTWRLRWQSAYAGC